MANSPKDAGRMAIVVEAVEKAEADQVIDLQTLTSTDARQLRSSTAVYHQRTKEEIQTLARYAFFAATLAP